MSRQNVTSIGLFNSLRSMLTSRSFTVLTVSLTVAIAGSPATAQSISIDGSTSTTRLNNSTSCSSTCSITGGTNVGSGLFHSFSNFNIDTGATVTFQNSGATNIFSRVTGASLTNIDGTLKVDGNANLYLLNPNGVIFGSNASLKVPGSFISTTANSILFGEDQSFEASSINNPSLLTVSVPTGLQFGSVAAPITVSGNGHALTYNAITFTVDRAHPSSGLIATPKQTIALIGGNISLEGGNLLSEDGRIEIGSVGDSNRIDFSNSDSGSLFDYSRVTDFRDVSLAQRSSIDVSSDDAGSVYVNSRNINIEESSAILAKVEDSGNGEISLNASDTISVVGESLSATQPMLTGAFAEIAVGATGDGKSRLDIRANTVDISQAGQIGLGMAGEGTAGNVVVTADTVNANGSDANSPSSLYAAVLRAYPTGQSATGQGGNLTINTDQLNVTDGAQLSTSTFDSGNAGNLTVNARDVRVMGRSDVNVRALSSIRSVSEIPPLSLLRPNNSDVADGSGNSGNVTINTTRLLVSESGQIGASTISNNAGGSLVIHASESIEIRDGDNNGRSGLFANIRGDRRVGVDSTGAGGSISIRTQRLDVLDGATINASASPDLSQTIDNTIPSKGTAGDIEIIASDITVKNGGFITADTAAGDRANVTIQADSLVLREGGRITTNATGVATGGNIDINAEALIAFENSDITANATGNFGGRIIVNSPTIIGTAYREQLTVESDITATSELGPAFSGSVELNSPEVNPTDGTVKLPESPNSEEQIAAACEKLDSNTFIATGRGGLPEGFRQLATDQSVWNDFRLTASLNVSASESSSPKRTDLPAVNSTAQHRSSLSEAQSWTTNANGEVLLATHRTLAEFSSPSSYCMAE